MCGILENFLDTNKELKQDYESRNPCTSRISQICEQGGKTRNIAIIDYWSQTALKPIHDHLMTVLSKIKTDATYSQEDQFAFSRKMASKAGCCYSFDLSSATDRFPIIFQEMVLKELFPEDIIDD